MKKKETKNVVKKKVEKKEKKEEESGGMDLDDAFADDEDVEYAPSKPRKVKKMSAEELEEELDEAEEEAEEIGGVRNNGGIEQGDVVIKASKPISQIKKGDKIKVDGKEYEVDTHYVLIDHGATKEMAIEIFDSKADKDYQLRYFSDQVETSIELYELQEIMYIKKTLAKIEW